MLQSRIADQGWLYPNLELTFEKKERIREKFRIWASKNNLDPDPLYFDRIKFIFTFLFRHNSHYNWLANKYGKKISFLEGFKILKPDPTTGKSSLFYAASACYI